MSEKETVSVEQHWVLWYRGPRRPGGRGSTGIGCWFFSCEGSSGLRDLDPQEESLAEQYGDAERKVTGRGKKRKTDNGGGAPGKGWTYENHSCFL